MFGFLFGVLLWLLGLAATIWVVITFLRLTNRIAIALEHQAGIEPPEFPRILAPAPRR
jgi:hypothetical protein